MVIAAALSLMNLAILRTFWRVRRSAFWISLIASVGVILFGVLEGILIAVVLSILLFFRRSWWPHGEVLGRVPDLDGWHDTDRYDDVEEEPGVARVPVGGARSSSRTPASSASRSATSFTNAARRGSFCSARRSPTST